MLQYRKVFILIPYSSSSMEVEISNVMVFLLIGLIGPIILLVMNENIYSYISGFLFCISIIVYILGGEE